MSNISMTSLTPEQALKRNFDNFIISEKKDGTLIDFKDGELFSPRCKRSERFSHILKLLKDNNFPECRGEMFIPFGNVFDVSRSENWKNAHFYPFEITNNKLTFEEKQILLKQLVEKANSEFITQLNVFQDVKSGLDYVKSVKGEGLVVRKDKEIYKIKLLQEVKIEISSHEPSKEKGTFILVNGNRVSGTSRDFVQQFNDIKKSGKTPIAEIEYPFMTEEGSYFQPRLRRIFIKGEGENGE